MGILNVTPDSFYDGSRYQTMKAILLQTEKMLREGADIIDIGAVSSKPGAAPVSQKEESLRLMPVIRKIISDFPEALLSVDTCRSGIADEALDCGAAMINDISGGRFDKKLMSVVAAYRAPYIIMHMQGTPATMQKNPEYTDVLKEVACFLSERTLLARSSGISDVIIDPGFGFGKSVGHNYSLMSDLQYLRISGCLLMAGISRKSMINRLLKIRPEQALNGTSVLNAVALLKHADILRVHDTKEAKEAIDIVSQLNQSTFDLCNKT
jgi:dihydropteroate synthase